METETTLFLCGDVMTGRGIDQVLPWPGDPTLREGWVRDARDYVALAERRHGPIARPVSFEAIAGDASAELAAVAPALRLINLETAITTSSDFWPGKEIHYRMAPRNVGCLQAMQVSACALANNHTLDFGPAGLVETLETLHRAGIATAGAGRERGEALAPASLALPGGGCLHFFSVGAASSGIPPSWAAGASRPGVAWLRVLDEAAARALAERVAAVKRAGDLAIVSIHQGGNWGYGVQADERRFAHALIEGGVDLVHGHSSHHPRPLELHRGKLVLYGCGDFLDDYEGISGYEAFRSDLTLMYFPTIDRHSGALVELRATPMQLRQLRPRRASRQDGRWLFERLAQISGVTGARLRQDGDGRIRLPGSGG